VRRHRAARPEGRGGGWGQLAPLPTSYRARESGVSFPNGVWGSVRITKKMLIGAAFATGASETVFCPPPTQGARKS